MVGEVVMRRLPRKQQGMVLVVALVLLMVVTMLGVNLASSGSMELKMARNMQETSMSFQSAEAGIAAVWSLVSDAGNPFVSVGLAQGDILDRAALFPVPGGILDQIPDGADVDTDLFVLERELGCPRVEEGSSADKIACDYYRVEAEHDGNARVRVAQGSFMRIFK